MKPQAVLWTAILGSPVIWFVNLEANFALAPLACTGRGKLFLYLVSGLALILQVATALMAFMQWQALKANATGEAITGSRHAMALAGFGISVLCFLVIAAQTIPNLLMAGCE